MARAINLVYYSRLEITETPDASTAPALSDFGASQTFDAYGATIRLDGDTTPAIDTAALDLSGEIPAGGTFTIDLTNVPAARDLDESIDATGKKVVAYQLRAAAENAANLAIQAGGTNGYALFGASGKQTLEPGRHLASCVAGDAEVGTPAVGSTAKILLVVGTEGDVFDFLAAIGE